METELGAYVLDALEPDETDDVQLHLSGCQTCQAELSSLTATVSWLSLLSPDDVTRIEQEDAAPTPKRRRRRLAPAIVAGALATSVAVGAAVALDRDPASSSAAVVHAVDPETHVAAAVSMSPRDSGTALKLTLTGAYPGGWCSLVARSRDGHRQTTATWVADADGTAVVSAATAIPADELSEFEVVTDQGRVLVRVPVSPHDT
jgi:hypothetical protein